MAIPRPIVPKPRTIARFSALGWNPLVIMALGLSVIPLMKKVLMLPLACFVRTTSTKFAFSSSNPCSSEIFRPSCIDFSASMGPGM